MADRLPADTSPPEPPVELLDLLGSLRDHIAAVEIEARTAAREAGAARAEVLRLRDEVVAAERDQQDLRAARARLERISSRGLLARILNKDAPASELRPARGRPR